MIFKITYLVEKKVPGSEIFPQYCVKKLSGKETNKTLSSGMFEMLKKQWDVPPGPRMEVSSFTQEEALLENKMLALMDSDVYLISKASDQERWSEGKLWENCQTSNKHEKKTNHVVIETTCKKFTTQPPIV